MIYTAKVKAGIETGPETEHETRRETDRVVKIKSIADIGRLRAEG